MTKYLFHSGRYNNTRSTKLSKITILYYIIVNFYTVQFHYFHGYNRVLIPQNPF